MLSKSHLIKDCDVYDIVDNFPSVISKAASVPAGSRNSSASTFASRSIPAASRNRPASIHAGRHIPAGRPTNVYFNNVSWHGFYDHMSMNERRWGSAVKSSAGNKEKLDDFVQIKGGTVTFGGTQDTNIIACTQDDDSESECDEQAILVPSFPSNSFSGPKVNDVFAPMENNLDYVEELARLQKQEHEAHSAAAKYGFEFSNETAEMLHQAEIATRRNLVLVVRDPAGSSVSTGGVPAGSVPAGSIPASSVPAGSVLARSVPTSNVPVGGVLAGSINFASFGDPAASESVPAVFNPDYAADSTLPPGHSLGSSEHSTRFPSPSDLGNNQPTPSIFFSSSYYDDFCDNVTNLASSVAVDPVATKRVNTIHPQSQIIGKLQSPVQIRSTV
nr:hypothetical protein [Tanacetum cinerariifolium]